MSILRLSEEIEEPKQELTELIDRFDTFEKKFEENQLDRTSSKLLKLEVL